MSLWQIVRNELRQIFVGDPRRIAFLFGAALAYLVIFGALYVPNIIKYMPIVICDEEQSPLSRELVRGFEDSDTFEVTAWVSTQEEMQQALAEKTAYAAVQIPKDFSRKIKTGGSASMLFMVNGSNIVLTNIGSSAAQDIAAAFSDKVAARNAALRFNANEELLAKRIAPVHCHLRVLSNTTQGYMLFFLLGLAMAAFQQGIIFSAGAAVQYEYRQAASFPGHAMAKIVAVKFGVYWVLSMLSFLMVVFVAQYFFDIRLKAALSELMLLAAFYVFAILSFCMLVAALFRNEMQFVRAAILYPVPAFVFSGYTWPHESMGPVMGTLAQIFPKSWLSNAVRELFTTGASPQLGQNLVWLLGIGIVCLLAFAFFFPREMKRHGMPDPQEGTENL